MYNVSEKNTTVYLSILVKNWRPAELGTIAMQSLTANRSVLTVDGFLLHYIIHSQILTYLLT